MEFVKNKSLGNNGEEIAKKFLEEKGLSFIAKNYRFHKKEIDLIFKDKKEEILIFVEVKTRRSKTYGNPEDSISAIKRKNFITAVNGFILENPIYRNFSLRIDTIGIMIHEAKEPEINHIENSFY